MQGQIEIHNHISPVLTSKTPNQKLFKNLVKYWLLNFKKILFKLIHTMKEHSFDFGENKIRLM